MRAVNRKKPDWLRVKLPAGRQFRSVRQALARQSLHTVCEEANCPNKTECWSTGTATFMILGDTCTRGCAFCAVKRGNPEGRFDPDEAQRVADAASAMGLEYVVITSVTRDDLPDGGAELFAATIRRIKQLNPTPGVEVLIPDYLGDALDTIIAARPDVIAHNIEVVERLSGEYRHPGFDFDRSLEVLARVNRDGDRILTKSSLMLGLGETDKEIEMAMQKLIDVGVRILVMGQYLSPTRKHVPVLEYIRPEKFDQWAERGREMGFDFVAAGPLVRTSYRAAEAFVEQNKNQTP
ncbi:lipoyl synthase [Geothermobacter hydrogeniphilus]|uniref:Lipoyl synthase n=1 Tax=Geothermobacter hydrogeniphilus TaxID=1969733 RepID=A0A1X0XWC2_9BACT|nr:lipoyl synthase [Geothermobacter hydrogeniphilus]ORJ57138.1 lipoyl synthase [Geothermobacter hydrogeniphilus]